MSTIYFQLVSEVVNYPEKTYYDLLKLATTELFFFFDNKLYKQIDGAAMDLPLGPTLAKAFLCHNPQTACFFNFLQSHI